MPFFKHDIGTTYYETKGKSDETHLPLVLLHGGPGGSAIGLNALFRLASHRKIIAYDQAGGGRSRPTDPKHWRIDSFVKELDALADRLKLDEFHIYSASWGTTLALEFYLRKNKGRVRSLTFQSPMFSAHDWAADAEILVRALPKKTRRIIEVCHEIGATDSVVYKEAMKEYYLRHCVRSETAMKKLFASFKTNTHGMKIYEHMWGPSEFQPTGTLKNYDRVNQLSKVKVPTLFLVGEHDEARPETVQRYAGKIKGAVAQIIPDASHSLLIETPKQVLPAVAAFLRAVETPAPRKPASRK